MANTESQRVSSTGDRLPPKGSREDVTEKAVAVFVLVLGVVLGLVDQRSGADTGLRVPALIASLFLVASSLNVLLPIGAKGHVEDDVEVEGPPGEPGRAVVRGAAAPPPPPPAKPSPFISILLMGIAVWLGLATLMYQDAEPQLTGLSLLASFLIFSRGLAELPGR
ncbi:hypothetical protein [Kineosporia sp. R_H_3]|uniref:hypothetical protein n=1 Tax=Kineosporia sp. R_H_3 TaxID=1961848 RepID=UPI001179A985|nr:hypothetical protein [Kineosporia sp. R_H_3]